MEIAAINALVGTILLAAGRKLFWLFVGAAGFFAGIEIAERFFNASREAKLLAALLIGIVAALLAIFFYKAAVAISGFIFGGRLALYLISYPSMHIQTGYEWIFYIIGGVVGAVLILLIFDWALIFLSSITGASLILRSISIHSFDERILFLILAIIGIAIQSAIKMREMRRQSI
jgi:hypothetical protein